MLRTALQPKWLGALVLATVFAAVCGWLGAWQLEEARAEGRAQAIERAASLPVAPLTEVVEPQSEFPRDGSTRRVTATGTYAVDDQVLIAERQLDGQVGYWVVSPFVVDGTGATIPVLRGFVADPDSAPAPPTGGIALAGGLAPSESPRSEAGLADGVYRSIDLGLLVNRWDTEVYNAFVFATEETALSGADEGAPAALEGLTRVPPPTGEQSELNLKNAMYAVQWWVFAAFAYFLWWRMVRQAHREELEASLDDGPPDRTPDRPPADVTPTDPAAADPAPDAAEPERAAGAPHTLSVPTTTRTR
ncbi:SURF1 family protein [Nostocoides sp. F2B08]|uniref:SURF1 family protein n=1 Tax=Nostocoides sp. F2B08 TaxID=2653936 RepID=UPI001263A222|nr:SURF1 family protein [Tetrasphaera sp. F2B08]KAB7743597.1 SURF1 family protein [Tetrasphaera sp. F2B08]